MLSILTICGLLSFHCFIVIGYMSRNVRESRRGNRE
jgi:hypothetical protein